MTTKHPGQFSHLETRRLDKGSFLCSHRVPDYAILAARIAISNLHKETKKTFSHVIEDLYSYGQFFVLSTFDQFSSSAPPVNPKNGRPSGMIAKDTYEIVMANADKINSAVIYDRDFSYVRPAIFSFRSR